jgi:hypothetical protein
MPNKVEKLYATLKLNREREWGDSWELETVGNAQAEGLGTVGDGL